MLLFLCSLLAVRVAAEEFIPAHLRVAANDDLATVPLSIDYHGFPPVNFILPSPIPQKQDKYIKNHVAQHVYEYVIVDPMNIDDDIVELEKKVQGEEDELVDPQDDEIEIEEDTTLLAPWKEIPSKFLSFNKYWHIPPPATFHPFSLTPNSSTVCERVTIPLPLPFHLSLATTFLPFQYIPQNSHMNTIVTPHATAPEIQFHSIHSQRLFESSILLKNLEFLKTAHLSPDRECKLQEIQYILQDFLISRLHIVFDAVRNQKLLPKGVEFKKLDRPSAEFQFLVVLRNIVDLFDDESQTAQIPDQKFTQIMETFTTAVHEYTQKVSLKMSSLHETFTNTILDPHHTRTQTTYKYKSKRGKSIQIHPPAIKISQGNETYEITNTDYSSFDSTLFANVVPPSRDTHAEDLLYNAIIEGAKTFEYTKFNQIFSEEFEISEELYRAFQTFEPVNVGIETKRTEILVHDPNTSTKHRDSILSTELTSYEMSEILSAVEIIDRGKEFLQPVYKTIVEQYWELKFFTGSRRKLKTHRERVSKSFVEWDDFLVGGYFDDEDVRRNFTVNEFERLVVEYFQGARSVNQHDNAVFEGFIGDDIYEEYVPQDAKIDSFLKYVETGRLPRDLAVSQFLLKPQQHEQSTHLTSGNQFTYKLESYFRNLLDDRYTPFDTPVPRDRKPMYSVDYDNLVDEYRKKLVYFHPPVRRRKANEMEPVHNGREIHVSGVKGVGMVDGWEEKLRRLKMKEMEEQFKKYFMKGGGRGVVREGGEPR
ncbi:hypothetical protein HK098_005525 [Nowakowskiella sp. JEL0407]|nr:hypothetical protein HK098_005525 [Nowakowskiella sp. JEL0407]